MNIDFSYDLDYDRKEHTGRIIKTILKILFWLVILAGAVVAGWAVTKFCVEKTKMVGNSMEGVLSNGDSVLINLLSYTGDDLPERFDVIVFEKSNNEHSYYGIRRVIGRQQKQFRRQQIYQHGQCPERRNNRQGMVQTQFIRYNQQNEPEG